MFTARETLALAAVAVLSSLCTAWLLHPACDSVEPLVELAGGRRRLLQVPSTVLSYDATTGTLTIKAERLALAASSTVIQGSKALKLVSGKTGRILLTTGTGASGESAGIIQLAPGGVPLTFSRVGDVSASVNADTLDVTDYEGNRIRWARANGTRPGGLKIYATEKLGLYTTVSSGPGKSGMELATAGGGGGGIWTDAISIAPGGMPNPIVFAASGADTTTLLVGRTSSLGLPSYLLWAQAAASDAQLIYDMRTACVQNRKINRQTCARRLQAAAAAGVAGQQGSPLDIGPTLVLAGFYIEEIAGVRQLLDEVGAAEVKVVPTTSERLYRPLGEVLATPEPQWDQPVPDDWLAGGGWGQQPVVLIAGLDQQESNILLDLLEESVSASLCPAFATPENLRAPLGEVLAAALKLWRQSGGGSDGAAAAGAVGGSAAAADAAAADAAEGVQFIEELPPLEEILAEPEAQAAESSAKGTGASSSSSRAEAADSSSGSRAGSASTTNVSSGSVARARQMGMSAAPEVVQAEFSERPAAAAAAAEEEEEDGGVPLDLIDAIASGSKPQGPPAATAAQATSARPAAPAARAEEGAEEDSMSSEELLAAARAALGLDSADLQRLVDEAAAKAAAATGVPFVPGGDAAGGGIGIDSSGVGSGFPGAPPTRAATPAPSVRPAPPKSSGSSGPKPWEAAASAAAASGAIPAAGTTSKGFGRPAPPSRKAAKAARRTAGSSSGSGNSADPAGQPAAAQQAASGASQGAAAAEARRQPEQDGEQEQGEQQAEEGHVLPPVDQFVLSRAQLKEVTEQHGLDYEQLLAGLKQRGIELTD